MEPLASVPGSVRFGVFEVDLKGGQLRKRGRKVPLQEQPFQVLALLLHRPGEIVTREDLQNALWPNGTIVEFEHGVNTAIKKLRKVLGDSAENPQFIETLPRRGYRFVARIEHPQPETVPSHYRILGEAGRGAMGVVYEAEDVRLHRRVALKFLPEGLVEEPAALARFLREAQSLAALSHPGICTLYGIDEHDGRRCLVMEYVEGLPLSRSIGSGPMEPSQALNIAIQIAEALAAAHLAGIVHRDLKPANIMLTAEGRTKLLDFGTGEAVAANRDR